jgi:hypothetical protein
VKWQIGECEGDDDEGIRPVGEPGGEGEGGKMGEGEDEESDAAGHDQVILIIY